MARVWLCRTKNIKLMEFVMWSLGRGKGGVIRYSFVCFYIFYGGVFYQWLSRLIIRGGNDERDELSTISGTFYISHTAVTVYLTTRTQLYTTLLYETVLLNMLSPMNTK